jgi:hypothetical protein
MIARAIYVVALGVMLGVVISTAPLLFLNGVMP